MNPGLRTPSNFDVYEKPDPDIKIAVNSVELDPRRTNAILRFKEPLNLAAEYIVNAKDVTSDGKIVGTKTICHQEKAKLRFFSDYCSGPC